MADSRDEARTLDGLLRELRVAAGLTQEQLAERAGLGVRTIRDLERGRVRRPHRQSVGLLAAAMDLEPAACEGLARAAGQVPVQPAGRGVATGGPMPRLLPPAVRHFVGRTDVLKTLDWSASEAQRHGGAVLISAIGGLAGIGKTALAVHWAHRVADRFPGGQLYVDLRGFGPTGPPLAPAEALGGFLDALGVPAAHMPAGVDARAARYRSLLADRHVLIVLDNARDAAQVRPLLPGSPGCLVIVTSRNRLDGLAASSGAQLLTLGLLSESDSGELLAKIVGAERAGAEPDAIAEIALLCGRLPLALAIAAARAAARPRLPLVALAAEFRDVRDRLDSLDTGDPATSVRAVFSWSSGQLTGSAARMFRLLGLHPGPDIGARAAASLAGIAPAQARRDLAEMSRLCLVTEQAPGRYAMHDLLRAYASEQTYACDSPAVRHAATRRLLDHYLHTAHAAALLLNPSREKITLPAAPSGVALEQLADDRQALAWFEAEHRVLISLTGVAAETGCEAYAWQLPWAMADFLDRRGHWNESVAVHRTALTAATRLSDKKVRAVARRLLAAACARLGEYDEARAHLTECLRLFRQLGDRFGEARVHRTLGWMFECQGRYADALGHAGHALVLLRAIGHQAGEADALNDAGWCHALLGEYEQARTFSNQALALYRKLGNRQGMALAWDTVGYADHHLGRFAEATAHYQRALRLFREVGDRFNEAVVLTHLGDARSDLGNWHKARNAWQQAMDILDELRHPDADRLRAKLRHLAAASAPRSSFCRAQTSA